MPTTTEKTGGEVDILDLTPPKGAPEGVIPYWCGILTEDQAAHAGLPSFQSIKNDETGEETPLRVPIVAKTIGAKLKKGDSIGVTFQQFTERVYDEAMKTQREKKPGGVVWLLPEQAEAILKAVKKYVVRWKGSRRGVFEGGSGRHGDIPFGCYCYMITVEEAGPAFENRRGRPATIVPYEPSN